VFGKSFIALALSDSLYAAAFSWYWYITHLGYQALPFLKKESTRIFLSPIVPILLVFIWNLVVYQIGWGYNASRIMAHLYFD
jgi:hypothetical protein